MRPLTPLLLVVSLCSLAFPSPARAQEQPAATDRAARWEAPLGDFDYLLGDWEYTADSKEFGKFNGRWSAVRLPEGQILDEWRVLGADGETLYVTTTLRAYNSAANRWELIGMDAGGGLLDFGTGRKVGEEMHIEQKFGVTREQPAIMRIRYFEITPASFSWAAERSTDDGRTWVKDHLTMQVRRIGPARNLAPLTPSKAQD